ETHHTQKKDAPSGTAITLANNILSEIERKKGWVLQPEKNSEAIEITSIRESEAAGIHTSVFDSTEDTITLTHNAKSREGFALGAVIAAEFLQNKTGFYSMKNFLKF
ncbi:MAG: 4-hydroxy-tetrahydrodipicolinate reductase, partial [Prevotellaceae bacterium]|nr:4-hydroxy-tetrahydrodipicolinate reductase [Prevotellaceae bacterium]